MTKAITTSAEAAIESVLRDCVATLQHDKMDPCGVEGFPRGRLSSPFQSADPSLGRTFPLVRIRYRLPGASYAHRPSHDHPTRPECTAARQGPFLTTNARHASAR